MRTNGRGLFLQSCCLRRNLIRRKNSFVEVSKNLAKYKSENNFVEELISNFVELPK